jgi:hypothetical protein
MFSHVINLSNNMDNPAPNKLTNVPIENNYLIGEDMYKNGSISHAFSFGTHLINTKYENISIGVGHIKILQSFNTETVQTIDNMNNTNWYVKNSVPIIVQKRLYSFMREKFPLKFKQNLSGFIDCKIGGYSYLSYFIMYNKRLKKFYISDFFFTVDIKDNYHFSLIFSIGIFKIKDKIYVTSGEGDYYSSVLTFNEDDIIKYCRHDALSKDFTIENCNYSIIIKDMKGTIDNIILYNGKEEVQEEVQEINRKLTDKILKINLSTEKLDFGDKCENNNERVMRSINKQCIKKTNYKQKYLKYKNKYFAIKNKF